MGDEDARRLAEAADTREARLMMLGVLADPELDVRRYLAGLNGRENLPWLLRRFEKDVAEAAAAVSGGASRPSASLVAELSGRLLRRQLDLPLRADAHHLQELADAHVERFLVHLAASE